MSPERFNRICEAYKDMASQIRYRPYAPGDGCGSCSLSDAQLQDARLLSREADSYARAFDLEELERRFRIGVAGFDNVRALVFAIEAARAICGADRGLAIDLLRAALKEMESTAKPRGAK